jgi:putative aldouronate transport system permease protein
MILWLFVFHYVPTSGIILAFKKYKIGSLWSGDWIGLENFERLFATPQALESIKITVLLSVQRIIFEFVPPIVLAILLSEMRGKKLKKLYQTVFTFPHFISWVIIAGMINNLFAVNGPIDSIVQSLGGESVNFLSDTGVFKSLIFVTANWKGMGWSSILYLATIAGIDPTLYEAAEMDGAGRLRRIWHITLAGMKPIIALKLIMTISTLLSGGFDQIFNMRNPVVSSSVLILDAYIYDITFNALPDYGFSTAVGLFKSVIGFVLLMIANKLSGIISGEQMYSFEKRVNTKKVLKMKERG